MNTRCNDLSDMCEEELCDYVRQYFESVGALLIEDYEIRVRLEAETGENPDIQKELWNRQEEIKQKITEAYKDFFGDDCDENIYKSFMQYYLYDKKLQEKIKKIYGKLVNVPKCDGDSRRLLKEKLRALEQQREKAFKDFIVFAYDLNKEEIEPKCYATLSDYFYVYFNDTYVETRIADIEDELLILYNRDKLLYNERKRAEDLERELMLIENYGISDYDIINMPLFGCSKERLLDGENEQHS